MIDHVNDGHRVGNSVLMGGHNRGHNDDVGHFADFGRLDVHREAGKMEPALVAGVVVRTEGNQHQKQQHVENHQSRPVLGQVIQIDGGNHGVDHHPQADGNQLNGQIFEITFTELIRRGSTGNRHHTEQSQTHAHAQQKHITLLGEIL